MRGRVRTSGGGPAWLTGIAPRRLACRDEAKGHVANDFVRLQDTAVAADIVADMHWESNLMKIGRRVNRRLRPQL